MGTGEDKAPHRSLHYNRHKKSSHNIYAFEKCGKGTTDNFEDLKLGQISKSTFIGEKNKKTQHFKVMAPHSRDHLMSH